MRVELLKRLLRSFALGVLLSVGAVAGPALAVESDVATTVARDPKLEADMMELSHKLRCLVCQNQSIAESNAPLAVDLRDQVREQLSAGRSKDEVIDYLVARYGDFVLYDPPFKAATLLLWLGPVLLLTGGAGWLGWRLRRRQQEHAHTSRLSDEERARARELLARTPESDLPESRS